MKLLTAFILLISMGCIPMAYKETVRPNGDSTPLEWTSTGANHYDQVYQDVGVLGTIPEADTVRIASLAGNVYCPAGDDMDTYTWGDWQGPSHVKIKTLTFRNAANYQGPVPSAMVVNVYIDDLLVGSVSFDLSPALGPQGGFQIVAKEESLVLDTYITTTQFNTMTTKITSDVAGPTLYAIECVAETTEKPIYEDAPHECKTIPTDSGTMEKGI